MDRVVDLILAILSSQVPEGKGWFARVVNGIKVAVYLTFVAIIVSLPLAAIGSMVWERWDEMPFGLRSVVGFLGLLFVVTEIGRAHV